MIELLLWYISSNPFGLVALIVLGVAIVATIYSFAKFKYSKDKYPYRYR